MASIFTRILNDEIPGTFVWRDEQAAAFMSINPMAVGHTLVVPIEEVDHWVEADDELIEHLFKVTRIIARAQRRAFSPERVGVIIAGYEVPHAHIHVVPTNDMEELSFESAATNVDREELERAAEVLKAELRAEGFSDEVPA